MRQRVAILIWTSMQEPSCHLIYPLFGRINTHVRWPFGLQTNTINLHSLGPYATHRFQTRETVFAGPLRRSACQRCWWRITMYMTWEGVAEDSHRDKPTLRFIQLLCRFLVCHPAHQLQGSWCYPSYRKLFGEQRVLGINWCEALGWYWAGFPRYEMRECGYILKRHSREQSWRVLAQTEWTRHIYLGVSR